MAKPIIGSVYDNYRYTGGDPSSQDSWQPVDGLQVGDIYDGYIYTGGDAAKQDSWDFLEDSPEALSLKAANDPTKDTAEGNEPGDRTWGEAGTDLVASFGGGANALLEITGTLYGLASGDMDNWARNQGAEGREWWNQLKSDGLTEREKERQAKIESADSWYGKAGTAFWETITDPALLSSFAAEQLPMFFPAGFAGRATAEIATVLGFGKTAAMSAGTAGAVGAGAGMQGADVGGDAYNDLLNLPEETWNFNEEYARRVDAGEDPQTVKEEIALSLSRVTAGEAGAISILANTLPGSRIFDRYLAGTGDDVKKGIADRVTGAAKGFLGEGTSEAVEEGGGQLAANFNVRDVDPNRALDEGVGEAAGMGFTSGVFGAGAGFANGAQPSQQGGPTQPPPPSPQVDPLAPPAPDVAPLDSVNAAFNDLRNAQSSVDAVEAAGRAVFDAPLEVDPDMTDGVVGSPIDNQVDISKFDVRGSEVLDTKAGQLKTSLADQIVAQDIQNEEYDTRLMDYLANDQDVKDLEQQQAVIAESQQEPKNPIMAEALRKAEEKQKRTQPDVIVPPLGGYKDEASAAYALEQRKKVKNDAVKAELDSFAPFEQADGTWALRRQESEVATQTAPEPVIKGIDKPWRAKAEAKKNAGPGEVVVRLPKMKGFVVVKADDVESLYDQGKIALSGPKKGEEGGELWGLGRKMYRDIVDDLDLRSVNQAMQAFDAGKIDPERVKKIATRMGFDLNDLAKDPKQIFRKVITANGLANPGGRYFLPMLTKEERAAGTEVQFSPRLNPTKDVPEMGINVRSDKAAGMQYADLIVDGKKTFETRDSDSLRPYVGKRVSIVRTGEGKAKAIGSVEIGEPIVVTSEVEFRKLQDQHLVPAGSDFDLKKGGKKYLYPVSNPTRFATEFDVGSGIVGRKVIQPASETTQPEKTAKPKKTTPLNKIEVGTEMVQVVNDKGKPTGEEAEVARYADEAIKDIDARLEALYALKECVG